MKEHITENQTNFTFPIGYFPFHKDKHINFQLNRWHSLGYWTKADARRAAACIQGVSDWKRDELIALAEQMDAESRKLAAAFVYRSIEFFIHPNDPEKIAFYNQFHDRFYMAVQDEQMEQSSIPYQDGSLPALRLSPENSKGTIIVHGGLDSFMEELFSAACYIVNAGYEVILFEGPGQGAAQRKSNLRMTHKWELPTSVVLDYFNLTNVTLVGISLGGYLALRAAAFDERIARVVAYDVAPYDLHGSGLQGSLYRFFIRQPAVYNWIAHTAMRWSVQSDLLISQWMYITGANTPADWNEQLQNFSVSDVALQIHQDVLLLAGAEDHMVPLKEYHNNVNGLINARSVTGRIFTAEEHAQNHCQVGNLALALDVILDWIGQKT